MSKRAQEAITTTDRYLCTGNVAVNGFKLQKLKSCKLLPPSDECLKHVASNYPY